MRRARSTAPGHFGVIRTWSFSTSLTSQYSAISALSLNQSVTVTICWAATGAAPNHMPVSKSTKARKRARMSLLQSMDGRLIRPSQDE
jgi:hypothetical protein